VRHNLLPSPAQFSKRRTELLERLTQLQEKIGIPESEFNVSNALKEIGDLIYTYKDEQGQPDPKALGVDKIEKIGIKTNF
jgi:hypothetical protein